MCIILHQRTMTSLYVCHPGPRGAAGKGRGRGAKAAGGRGGRQASLLEAFSSSQMQSQGTQGDVEAVTLTTTVRL